MTERFRVGRIFLVGDAAHIHSAAGGQVMNTGIGDAYNLGWELALVAKGFAHESLLDPYEAEPPRSPAPS
jgi:2-polyprenyl-6-methoxyphenol hydroxylase-like FAD-dependent oxidoreductase